MKYDATQALHKYLHDEGVWPDDDGPVWPSGDHDWHMRVCEGISALASQPVAEGLDAIVCALANLSAADSPEFRDPGWEDAVRSLIRRARLAAERFNREGMRLPPATGDAFAEEQEEGTDE